LRHPDSTKSNNHYSHCPSSEDFCAIKTNQDLVPINHSI